MAGPDKYGVERATLTLLDPKTGKEGKQIDFQFNPKEWSITHATDWKAETAKKGKTPPEFKGSRPAAVSVEMFLDAEQGDVSKTVTKLLSLVMPEPESVISGLPSPPLVLFQWGSAKAVLFKGYVESIAVKYTRFRADGMPIRGSCTLAMKEFPTAPEKQNPTSGGGHGHRSHRLVLGDTLASVAYDEYGDPTQWRRIAELNAIDDPLRVSAGAVVKVPSL